MKSYFSWQSINLIIDLIETKIENFNRFYSIHFIGVMVDGCVVVTHIGMEDLTARHCAEPDLT